MIEPYYPSGKRGRPPREIEQMLRMLLLQVWFNLSDEGVEDAIYDSYAMKTFMGLNFAARERVPDATTLCKFRKLMTVNGLQDQFFEIVQRLLERSGRKVSGGTIVDATIIESSKSTKNRAKKTDPEMHSVKKREQLLLWHTGTHRCRPHLWVCPNRGHYASQHIRG